MITPQIVDTLRQQGKTFQEIANMYGCSRQYVHQLANGNKTKMKVPTKSELYAQIEALTRENIVLQEKLDAEKHKRWREKVDDAFEKLYELSPFSKREMYETSLVHIDDAGYWFTFELFNDNRKQTFCVRHTDL